MRNLYRAPRLKHYEPSAAHQLACTNAVLCMPFGAVGTLHGAAHQPVCRVPTQLPRTDFSGGISPQHVGPTQPGASAGESGASSPDANQEHLLQMLTRSICCGG